MKKILLLSVFLTSPLFADCTSVDSSEVLYDGKTMKITQTKGTSAQKMFESLDAPETPPSSGSFNQKFLKHAKIISKKLGETNCWKINPPKFSGKKFVGVSECVEYSCNVTEKKPE